MEHGKYDGITQSVQQPQPSLSLPATQSLPSRSHQLRVARWLKLHCFGNGSRADIVRSRDSVAGESLQGFLVFKTQLYSLLELFPAVSRYDESAKCRF
jgi:hypothetical protein